jgi:hypothetical protein
MTPSVNCTPTLIGGRLNFSSTTTAETAQSVRQRARGLDVRGSTPGKFFSTPKRTEALDSPSISNRYRRGAVKRPGREADHSPSSNADVKNGGDIPPLPPCVFTACIVYRMCNTFQILCITNIIAETSQSTKQL